MQYCVVIERFRKLEVVVSPMVNRIANKLCCTKVVLIGDKDPTRPYLFLWDPDLNAAYHALQALSRTYLQQSSPV
jgi:hypothetical protein